LGDARSAIDRYFPIRGGSRKAMAKNNTPIAKVKIKM
jgi:hypothetical protein